jgi:subtilisin family serine protease
VLDTGVDVTHPALAGHLLPGFDFVNMDTNPSEVGNPNVGPYGHGTHVAGLIALVAPEAKIIPVRVLDQNGLGNTWVLAEALAYAVDPDGNPATHDGADVINLSLSTLRRTRLLRSVLAKVCDDEPSPGEEDFPATASANLVIVAAAGNGGDFTEQYPAAENIGGLIAVAASTSQDQLAAFSTRGSWIRVAAPGQGITSTVPGAQYGTWNGTSMAAPFVAAEAALIHAQFPMIRNTKIIDHIAKTGARIDGPVPVRINLGRALTSTPELEATPTPTPTPTPSSTPVAPPGLLTQANTNRAIALHAVLQTAEPFSLLTPGNFSSDQRTRVTLFASNIQLFPGETLSAISVSSVDTRNVVYLLPVESISPVPGVDGLSAVTVRLPADVTLKGDLSITLGLRGVKSNTAVIAIRSP